MQKTKFLIIQTAFIGDVILSTSLIELIKKNYPDSQIDFFLRKGNESIIESNPHISKLFIWNKSNSKTLSLLKLLFQVRKQKYDYVLNIQRFFNSGFITAFSNGKVKIGFSSNPLSFLFNYKVEHKIPHRDHQSYLHEVQRNAQLLLPLLSDDVIPNKEDLLPKIYFNDHDRNIISGLNIKNSYYVIAPSSVWYTKQWHEAKWRELIIKLSSQGKIILIGAPSDMDYIAKLCLNNEVLNLCGKLSLRQSALLMQNATRVFVNDSAPLHLASAVNAKTTAIFCSTIPDFGYSPLSIDSKVVQLSPRLPCMPCGLHGHKQCPHEHFNCAMNISIEEVLKT